MAKNYILIIYNSESKHMDRSLIFDYQKLKLIAKIINFHVICLRNSQFILLELERFENSLSFLRCHV